MKNLLLTLFLVLSFITSANAVMITVPGNYPTIQAAINASANGDTVLVEPGTYFENIIFRGKKIVLTSRFYIAGNYSFISSTIINGSTPLQPDSASCVRIHNGEDSTTVLQGFTITGGKGTKWQDEQGAGRYTEGGGILVALCHPIIQYNIIDNNSCIDAPSGIASTGGGGIRVGNGHSLVRNNIIRNNRAMYGGGIVCNHSTGTVMNNVIFNNLEFQAVAGRPNYGGGGVWINGQGESSKLINNTIVKNSAMGLGNGGNGGGITLRGVVVNVRNNIVWGNTQRIGSQIQTVGGSYTIVYNDVDGGYPGAGNINAQPLFDSTNYYLSALSPCVDKGDSSIIYNDPADVNPLLAKFPSKGTVRNDMGAYGGPASMIIASSVVGVQNQNSGIAIEYKLEQNYPNPFNPSTVINYNVPASGYIMLAVYDLSGRLVEMLANEYKIAGNYSASFNGKNFSSGVYLYKIIAGGFTDTKKMLLIK